MQKHRKRQLRDDFFEPVFGNPSRRVELLIEKLNSPDQDQIEKSVRDLLRNMRDFEDAVRGKHLSKSYSFLLADPLSVAPLRAKGFSTKEISRIQEIKRLFGGSQYSLIPTFSQNDGWQFLLMPVDQRNRQADKLNWRLALIQGLGEAHLLSVIRECVVCGRWYRARREAQQFCTAACRQKDYQTSDQGRAKRAQYMRTLRAKEKREDEEALKVVRRLRN